MSIIDHTITLEQSQRQAELPLAIPNPPNLFFCSPAPASYKCKMKRKPLSKKELSKALLEVGMGNLSVLAPSDRDDGISCLADAFIQDPLFLWSAATPLPDEKKETLVRFLLGWMNHRILTGATGVAVGVRQNGELLGTMTLKPSSNHKETILDILAGIWNCGWPPMYKDKEYPPHSRKRLESMAVVPKRREEVMSDAQNRWIYIQSIGVRKSGQGKGIGKRMLNVAIAAADKLEVPIFLETESEGNVAMYRHFGFENAETLELSADGDTSDDAKFTMWLMRKEPGRKS